MRSRPRSARSREWPARSARLDLRAVPSEKIARLRSEAAAVAVGYTLVRWEGPTPPEYLESLAGVLNAYADAPHDAGYEAQVWNGDLVRDRADAVLAVMGLHVYRIAAVHAASGALAAMTELAVDPRDPQCAYQGLTAVTRQHRGHRLGLLVKTAMLEWLAEVRADGRADRDRERDQQRSHDRGQRGHGLRGGLARLPRG